MRFIVDECTGPTVARWLTQQGHEVYSVFDEAPGSTDDEVLKRAFRENRILVTNDKDFGEKVYRERLAHHGVILLRLKDERSSSKVSVLRRLLEDYSAYLPDRFTVATEEQVRFATDDSRT